LWVTAAQPPRIDNLTKNKLQIHYRKSVIMTAVALSESPSSVESPSTVCETFPGSATNRLPVLPKSGCTPKTRSRPPPRIIENEPTDGLFHFKNCNH
jgi:hypothetical protein